MSSSFAYVYDDRLAERKFQRDLSSFEADLAGFGIGGRIARMSLYRKVEDMVREFARDGIRHVVIVGDDDTLLRMMWFLPELSITVGFVPLIGSERLAKMLGIKNIKTAVNVLAGRLSMLFDVGKVGDRYFLTDAVIPDTRAELEIDGKFKLRPTEGGTITVTNLGKGTGHGETLDVRVSIAQPKRRFAWTWRIPSPETKLRLTEGYVRSDQPVTLVVDGQSLQGTSFKIGIFPDKLRFLVGKGIVSRA